MRHTFSCNQFSFFGFINHTYGYTSVKLLKLWIKLRKSSIMNGLRSEFLRNCLKYDLVPSHIYFLLRSVITTFK